MQMDHDDAVTMPTEAQLSKWARMQLQDSRFMQLPADLARLLICYVRDATNAEHQACTHERAKELLWVAQGAVAHTCKLDGNAIVGSTHGHTGGTVCDFQGCAAWVCNKCMLKCHECEYIVCNDHFDTRMSDAHVCEVCKHVQCRDCYEDRIIYHCAECKRELCWYCLSWSDGRVYKCTDGYGCMMQN
jgi:hypothetical protein